MRVLIGTPIHVSKDYSMERWLANVSKLKDKADLMLVDNSPGTEYVKKVKNYCKKYGLKPIIKHLTIPQGKNVKKSINDQIHERIIRSEEIIREKVLSSNYDIWFFWENDILIPNDSLGKLVNLMELGKFSVVIHNCWINNVPNQVNFHFGITLFSRKILEKYSFIPDFDSAGAPPSWYEAEEWYRKRLKRERNNFIEVTGLIEPVYHLDK